MLSLKHSPIELPSGVCSQFIITRISLLVDDEVGISPSVIHLHQFPLHQISFLIVEFNIKHATDLGRLAVVGLGAEGREPDGVANEVAGVVHVDIYFLLRQVVPETLQVIQ